LRIARREQDQRTISGPGRARPGSPAAAGRWGTMPGMTANLSWSEFGRQRPDLAEAGRALFYQVGVGLAFLSTVRADGGPRLHPMCPLIVGGALVAHIIPSAKRDDLHRDGRYAMHSFPCDDNEDAFYITGRAALVGDASLARAQLRSSLRSATCLPSHRASVTGSSSSSGSAGAC
jgi:hypothetical protein